jgi:hypothetical protein
MDYVKNGCFTQTGTGNPSLTGWDSDNIVVDTFSPSPPTGITCTNYAKNNSTAFATLDQTISGLATGSPYNLSFYATSTNAANILGVSIGTTSTTQIALTSNWEPYNIPFTANGNNILFINFTTFANSNVAITQISITSTPGPCFRGDSKILTRNIQTGEIRTINASQVRSAVHEVFSINDKQFIPIIYNIVSGPNTNFVLIKKDTFGENQPSDDFYITGGHPIVIDGKEIESQNIPQGSNVNISPCLVYTFCTKKREPLMINGLAVLSWSLEEWNEKSKEYNISWYDNMSNVKRIME